MTPRIGLLVVVGLLVAPYAPAAHAQLLRQDAPVGSVALAPDGTVAVGSSSCCPQTSQVAVSKGGGPWEWADLGPGIGSRVAVGFDATARLLAIAWGGPSARTLTVRERRADGSWTPAAAVGEAVGAPSTARVAVGRAGDAVATWRVDASQYAIRRDRSGRWGPIERVGPATRRPEFRQWDEAIAAATVAADGTAWVAWERPRDRLGLAVGRRRSAFATRRVIGVRVARRPVIAAADDGTATVAWVGRPRCFGTFDFDLDRDYECADVYAATVLPRPSAPRAVNVTQGRAGTAEVYVAVSPAGQATLTWSPENLNDLDARYAFGDGGRFSPVRRVTGYSGDYAYAGAPPVAAHENGTVLLLADQVVLARHARGAFSPAFRGAFPAFGYFGAGLAVAGDRVLAVWQKTDEHGVTLMYLDPPRA